ncbi:hypothetical protein F9U64_21540 [Gracilibacillus oryzae]|uniref:Integral membrane protein n=1 Tax=Gracilibacillus oryzae TaxID=1672701 RepID=A0A7C8KWA2_9BACI|nr:hypothetical protein [Gracilibacillus oryzae]KAB8125840.1 hypothetical protein F9U64_21540 [Gracilibacillus oryzae]
MKDAFSKMFWGYILVLIEIHLFVIDILADPVGYFLIYLGINHLVNEFPIGHKAKNLAIVLILLSIPTVFVVNIDAFSSEPVLSRWSIYGTVLSLLKLILIFYIFQLMMEIANSSSDPYLIGRTEKTFLTYIIIMALISISQPFTMNFSMDVHTTYVILTIVISLIMEVVLLVLLRRFMKVEI